MPRSVSAKACAATSFTAGTSAFSETGPAINGTHHPFLTGWDRAVNTDGKPKHRPSEMITGGLYGFLSGYGHEDVKLRKE